MQMDDESKTRRRAFELNKSKGRNKKQEARRKKGAAMHENNDPLDAHLRQEQIIIDLALKFAIEAALERLQKLHIFVPCQSHQVRRFDCREQRGQKLARKWACSKQAENTPDHATRKINTCVSTRIIA